MNGMDSFYMSERGKRIAYHPSLLGDAWDLLLSDRFSKNDNPTVSHASAPTTLNIVTINSLSYDHNKRFRVTMNCFLQIIISRQILYFDCESDLVH